MKQITLSIPEPCHEGWHNMTPSEKGRFCGSCQKEVIDFTGMTDAELFAFFAQKHTGSVCGRTHIGQLDTPIAKPLVHKKKRFWYLQYAATFLLLLTKPGGAKAQAKPPVTTAPTKPTRVTMGMVFRQPIVAERLVFGKIQTENGDPVPYASIRIKGTPNGVAADAEGKYQLKIKGSAILTISSASYNSKEIIVQEKETAITTILEKSPNLLEGQIILVGGISSNYDNAIGYDVPRHKSLLQVKDKTSGQPIAKALIGFLKNTRGRKEWFQTNDEGEYLLRKIKADEFYTVTIVAIGYQETNIIINGSDLKSGNNPKTVLLEKEAVVQNLEEVVVTGIKPYVKASTSTPGIESLLAGKIGCGIVQPSSGQGIPALQPNPFAQSTHVDQMLMGRVGGITVRPAIPPKRKSSFLKKIFLRSEANNKAGTTKVPANTKALVSTYPNPAKINTPIVVAFGKVPKGSYRLQLINGMGSLVQQQTITVPVENFNFQWPLDGQVAAGSYIVHITSAHGKIIHSSKLIVLP
jgi:CarboxypepD_reg-like domain